MNFKAILAVVIVVTLPHTVTSQQSTTTDPPTTTTDVPTTTGELTTESPSTEGTTTPPLTTTTEPPTSTVTISTTTASEETTTTPIDATTSTEPPTSTETITTTTVVETTSTEGTTTTATEGTTTTVPESTTTTATEGTTTTVPESTTTTATEGTTTTVPESTTTTATEGTTTTVPESTTTTATEGTTTTVPESTTTTATEGTTTTVPESTTTTATEGTTTTVPESTTTTATEGTTTTVPESTTTTATEGTTTTVPESTTTTATESTTTTVPESTTTTVPESTTTTVPESTTTTVPESTTTTLIEEATSTESTTTTTTEGTTTTVPESTTTTATESTTTTVPESTTTTVPESTTTTVPESTTTTATESTNTTVPESTTTTVPESTTTTVPESTTTTATESTTTTVPESTTTTVPESTTTTVPESTTTTVPESTTTTVPESTTTTVPESTTTTVPESTTTTVPESTTTTVPESTTTTVPESTTTTVPESTTTTAPESTTTTVPESTTTTVPESTTTTVPESTTTTLPESTTTTVPESTTTTVPESTTTTVPESTTTTVPESTTTTVPESTTTTTPGSTTTTVPESTTTTTPGSTTTTVPESTTTTVPKSTTTTTPGSTTTTVPESTTTTTPGSTTTTVPESTTTTTPGSTTTTVSESTTTTVPESTTTTVPESTTTTTPGSTTTTVPESTTTTVPESTTTTTPGSTTTTVPESTTTTVPESTTTTTPGSTTTTATETTTTTTTESTTTSTTTGTTTSTEQPTTTTTEGPTTIITEAPSRGRGLMIPDFAQLPADILNGQDDGCIHPHLRTSFKFPFGNDFFDKIYVCVNGFVALQAPYNSWSVPLVGGVFSQRHIIAPFMTDLDTRTNGSILYKLLDVSDDPSLENDIVVLKGKQLVEQHFTSSYQPMATLIVTWDSVPAWNSNNKEATFQLIFTMNDRSSYAFYAYEDGYMNVYGQPIYIGEVMAGAIFPRATVTFILEAPDENLCGGNTCAKCTGSGVPSISERCKAWYKREKKDHQDFNRFNNQVRRMGGCACNLFTLLFDGRYIIFWFDVFDGNDLVTAYLLPNQAQFGQAGKTCVYSIRNGTLIQRGPDAGYVQRYNYLINRRGFEQDRIGRSLCCIQSDNCNLFQELRPKHPTCESHPRFVAISIQFGDPHFTTLDGFTYTFNGRGEYILVDIPSEMFQVQSRTDRAITETGNFSLATVFTAFAVQGNNTFLQVELNADRSAMVVFIGTDKSTKTDFTTSFSQDLDRFIVNQPGISVTRSNQTLVARFVNTGITFNVTLGDMVLQSSLGLPDRFRGLTTGLLGNNDDDSTNDLLPRGGTTPLPVDSSEETIFDQFGNTWITSAEDSIFFYPPCCTHATHSFPDFRPGFFDAISDEQRNSAIDACNGDTNKQCLYDFVFTGNRRLAQDNIVIEDTFDQNIDIVANDIPRLYVTEGATLIDEEFVAHVTVGQEHTIKVVANDSNPVVIEYVVNTVGSTFTTNPDNSFSVTFTLQNTDIVQLGFVGTDSLGALSPELDILIVVCSGCNSPNGACNFTSYREADTTYDSFKVAMCDCLSFWEGNDCDVDYDGCEESDCAVGQNCTDALATDQMANDALPQFTCSDCPNGYFLNGSKCSDINECADASSCINAACTNVVGSFSCRCNDGFKTTNVPNTCIDIDECADSSDNCDQICENTDGGFTCSCNPGYIRNDTACKIDGANQIPECNNTCGNADGCTLNDAGVAICFCNNGYELVNSSYDSTCTDTNECDLNLCSQTCANTEGSFSCSCYTGYSLESDLLTCTACSYPFYGDNCASTCQCGEGEAGCDPVRGCVCLDGWTGDRCDTDIDECDDLTTCNQDNENCVNSIGSYSCECKVGFEEITTDSGASCADIDECSSILQHDCQQTCNNTLGGYVCDCHSGYQKNAANTTHCDDIDECEVSTHGCNHLCENVPGRYNCDCYAGYVLLDDRRTCVKVEDLCAQYSTKNCSHICTVIDSQPVCSCESGFYLGADNQTCIDVNECQSSTLNRCSVPESCLNSDGGYTCSCPIGFSLQNDGRTCFECDEYHYGENCALECNCGEGSSGCDREIGCICIDGWAGEKCNSDVNECENSPCTGDNEVCVNIPGSYICKCDTGYENVTGSCVDIDECSSVTLNLCTQICDNTIGGFECSCNEGFVADGFNCNDFDECAGLNNCDQVCENTVGSYKCSCNANFKLNDDKTSCSPLFVCDSPGICVGSADCVKISGVDTCVCRNGYEFDTNSNTNCIDIKECGNDTLNACTQQCIEEPGTYSCACDQTGYQLDSDAVTCIECTQGTWGDGCAENCSCNEANTAYCNPVNGSCTCESGWQGTECNADINECSEIHPCPDNSACFNNLGSFVCQCTPGYIKSDDGTCAACDSRHWGQNCATECSCITANTLDCNDQYGTCECLAGWKGTNCETDINECTELTDVCNDTLKTCVNTVGSHECNCNAGYTINSDYVCVDDNECLLGTDNCTALGQQCVNNNNGSFDCICADGYSGDGNTCTPCPANTWGTNCNNTCSCNNTNTAECDPAIGCVCESGWESADCSVDIDECVEGTYDCRENSICANEPGSYSCPCLVGYLDNDGNTCTACDQNTYGNNCTESCDCIASNAIFVDQTCNHTTGECLCTTRWSGARCELPVDVCEVQDPCLGDFEMCHYYVNNNTHVCSCIVGYDRVGDACESSDATTTTTAVPVGEIGIFIYVKLNLTIERISLSHNLTVKKTLEVYTGWTRTGLENFFRGRMTVTHFRRISITLLTEGSLKVNFTAVIANTTEAKQSFAVAADQLASGEIVNINNQPTSAQELAIAGQNVDLTADTETAIKCLAYKAAEGPCGSNEECIIVDTKPVCEPKKTDDNLALILGLGIGIPLFFIAVLLIAIICVVYVRNRKRTYGADDLDRTTFNQGFFPAVLPTKVNTWGKSDPMFGPYGWEQQTEGSFTTSSSSDDTQRKRRRRRREETYPEIREEYVYDNQNNFSWDFLYNYIGPNERYEIQRPQVDRL